MRLPARNRQYGLRVNLMPLNDIVFLLIIFLVAAPHFKPTEREDDVELSKVDINRGAESAAERRLEITVAKSGEMRVLGKPVSPAEMEQRIREFGSRFQSQPGQFELRIRSDRRAKFGVVKPLLKTCVKAGITNIKFAVLPSDSPAG